MAKSLIQLNVFFSSTSELEAERLLFKEVLDDVNEIVEQTSRVTLETGLGSRFRPTRRYQMTQ
ncbi:hypothetical protein L0222_16035 [bacterium]|nr:hypothetical protein [bacterium]